MPNSTNVSNNKFVIRTGQPEIIQRAGSNFKTTADTNIYEITGKEEFSVNKLSEINLYFVKSVFVALIDTASYLTNFDSFYLLENGHEFVLKLNVDSKLAGSMFKFPTTGNIVPLIDEEFELQPASVYTVVCRFKQNGTKWVETKRQIEYADGRIVDSGTADLDKYIEKKIDENSKITAMQATVDSMTTEEAIAMQNKMAWFINLFATAQAGQVLMADGNGSAMLVDPSTIQ